jgi:hypothetical protein
MAAIRGRVVEVRRDEGCRYMDPISIKYTGAPFPSRGRDRVCFVIAVEKAAQRTLDFVHSGARAPSSAVARVPGSSHSRAPNAAPYQNRKPRKTVSEVALGRSCSAYSRAHSRYRSSGEAGSELQHAHPEASGPVAVD